MKMISIFLPELYLEAIEDLIREGHFPNRSEAIRMAIRDLILKERNLVSQINKSNKEQEKAKNEVEEY